jgi:hypothetical protein
MKHPDNSYFQDMELFQVFISRMVALAKEVNENFEGGPVFALGFIEQAVRDRIAECSQEEPDGEDT